MTAEAFEARLAALLRGATPGADALVSAQIRLILGRQERGVGRLRDRMAPLFDAWHGTDDELIGAFCAAAEGATWSDHGAGPLIEEALATWAVRTGLVDEATATRCVVDAGARLLSLGKPGPACFRRTSQGWIAMVQGEVTLVQGTRILRQSTTLAPPSSSVSGRDQ